MADGILGLGSSGSTGLNQELINKLKESERKAQVEPIETRLEDWDTEVEQFGEIEAKILELLNISKDFDLFSTDSNAFEEVYATTSGTSVSFDATDTSNLKPGTIAVTVDQVAQKDVYQSGFIADITATMSSGTIDIDVGGDTLSFSTDGKTYENLVTEMNNYPQLDVALEKVSETSYRMVIKSGESGLDNALTITESGAGLGFGSSYSSATTFTGTDTVAGSITINGTTFTNDGVTPGQTTYQDLVDQINADANFTASIGADGTISVATASGDTLSITSDTVGLGLEDDSQTVKAQNTLATVDGIDYDVSSNQIVMQNGLSISVLSEGDSSISMQQDTTSIESKVQEMIATYNELVDLVSDYTVGGDSKIEDKSTLRTILSQVKDIMFGSDYGTNDDKSIFSYGFSLDKSGHLSLDSATFGEALVDDLSEVKSLFIGVAEDKGLGTRLKEYLDDLDSFDGLLTSYGDSMSTRRDSLEEEKAKAIESLDNKYAQLANQFAAYTAIISQFENSFGGLQMMIAQSKASG